MDYQTDILYSKEDFVEVYKNVYRANSPREFMAMGLWDLKKVLKTVKVNMPSSYPCLCISMWDAIDNPFAGTDRVISSPKFIFLFKMELDLWSAQLHRTENENKEEKQKGFIV